MEPDVLHLILCDDVQIDPTHYHRYNVLGLITSIRSVTVPPFPVVYPRLLALVVWTGGQGTGELTWVEVLFAGSVLARQRLFLRL